VVSTKIDPPLFQADVLTTETTLNFSVRERTADTAHSSGFG